VKVGDQKKKEKIHKGFDHHWVKVKPNASFVCLNSALMTLTVRIKNSLTATKQYAFSTKL